VGDRVLALNDVDVTYLQHLEITRLIRESGNSIKLTIEPRGKKSIEETNNQSFYFNETMSSNNFKTLPMPEKKLNHSPLMQKNIINGSSIHKKKLGAAPMPFQQQSHIIKSPNQFHIIELYKLQANGYGFSIRGGSEWQMAIFILKIADHGAAHLDGRLQVGDQILEINGVDAFNMTHNQAKDHIKSSAHSVVLLVRRTGLDPPSLTEMLSRTNNNPTTKQLQPHQHHHHHQHQQQNQSHQMKHFRSYGALNNENGP
jgi:hypothetical protein